MNVEVMAARMFPEPEFAKEMFPMPAHRLPPRELDGYAGKVKQASMRFVHVFTISTGDASPRLVGGAGRFRAFYREKPRGGLSKAT